MAYASEAGTELPRGGYAKRHRTRALILDAALAEASERGLHRASVTGIATRANTAVGKRQGLGAAPDQSDEADRGDDREVAS